MRTNSMLEMSVANNDLGDGIDPRSTVYSWLVVTYCVQSILSTKMYFCQAFAWHRNGRFYTWWHAENGCGVLDMN